MQRGFLREVNKQIHELLVRHGVAGDYICECERASCDEPWIAMRPEEFEAIAAAPGCYLVALGHQPSESEIVWRGDGYLVVRNTSDDEAELHDRGEPRPRPAKRRVKRRSGGGGQISARSLRRGRTNPMPSLP